MAVMWQEEMRVGNAKIDNDHKYLISIINTIEAAMDCEASSEALSAYVSELFDYSFKHFQREEKYQDEIKFPDQEAHKKEHQDLMEQIKQIHDNLQSHADSGAYKYTTPGLVHVLRDWFMHHFSQEDMKMKKYFI
jgi:hemerythrin-like metal-binding protein